MMSPIMYVLLSFVPFGILSLALEVWHRFHAGDRRLPVKDKLLRPPGESCRSKMENLNDKISEIIVWVIGFPSALLICYLSSTGTEAAARPISGLWISALVVAGGIFLVFLWKLISHIKERNYWRLCFSAERAVGEQLNQLMCDGCRVLHDFPLADNGNIDHIVIAPSGVYAIETKAWRKGAATASQQAHEVIYDGCALEFPFHINTKDLAFTRDHAVNLGKILVEALQEEIFVKPILTLPGWFIIIRGTGDVAVLNPRMIDSAILTPTAPVLTPERIKTIARLLEQKCRDVEF